MDPGWTAVPMVATVSSLAPAHSVHHGRAQDFIYACLIPFSLRFEPRKDVCAIPNQAGLWGETKSQSERFVNFRHPARWHHTCKIRLVALRFQEARGIQGTQLKAKKEGIVGKAGFPGRHPRIGGIISRYIG